MLHGPLLPVPEEYMLYFPFVRKRVAVRVKEHDRSSCVWLSENDFRRVVVDGFLFH